MCGITGIVHLKDPQRARDIGAPLAAMTDALYHRGPDDGGMYLSPDRSVGLGNRRLAIRDLSPAGHMPMGNRDGTIWITNRPNERGYRASDDVEAMPAKDKPDTKTAKKDKSKNKSKDKDKDKDKDDAEAKDKKPAKDKADTEKTDDDPDKMEKDAARKLSFAKILLSDGKTDKAKTWLNDIVTKFPSTKAADEAKELLKKLDK